MKRIIVLLLGLILVAAINCSAFDGSRKGFVLGGGIGFAPYAHWSSSADDWTFKPLVDETGGAFASHLLTGYAWDDRNMAVVEMNWVFYGSDIGDIYGDDVEVHHMFIGPAWYHYFGLRGHSFYSSVGVGRYGFGQPGTIGVWRGWSYMVSGGYEFTKQVQAGVVLVGGKGEPCCDSDSDLDVGSVNISLLLTVVAY